MPGFKLDCSYCCVGCAKECSRFGGCQSGPTPPGAKGQSRKVCRVVSSYNWQVGQRPSCVIFLERSSSLVGSLVHQVNQMKDFCLDSIGSFQIHVRFCFGCWSCRDF